MYCLVDTPDLLVEDEKRRTSWKSGYLELPEKISQEIERNMYYMDIPKELRVKTFKLEYSQEAIDSLYQRIKECRSYLNTLSEQLADKLILAV